jgi:hypothetical protein
MENSFNVLACFKNTFLVQQIPSDPFYIVSERFCLVKNADFIAALYEFVYDVAADET